MGFKSESFILWNCIVLIAIYELVNIYFIYWWHLLLLLLDYNACFLVMC